MQTAPAVLRTSAYTVSVADNKLVSDVSFDQSGYSEFKYGSTENVPRYSQELVRLGELFHLKSSEIVVTGTPFRRAPNSAHFLALGVTLVLQKLGMNVHYEPIYQQVIPAGDYSYMSSRERAERNKSKRYCFDKESFTDKHVIVVDDMRVTGSIEKSVTDMLQQSTRPLSTTCLSLVQVDSEAAKINPEIEGYINHFSMNSLEAIAGMMQRTKSRHCVNARLVKRVLEQEDACEVSNFFDMLNPTQTRSIYDAIIQDGLDKHVNDKKGRAHDGVWRVVICTEDSVADGEVQQALLNVSKVLRRMSTDGEVCTYVRARNHGVFRQILQMDGVEKIDGFVIPKVDTGFETYAQAVATSHFKLMPILESNQIVSQSHCMELLEVFDSYRNQIDCLRIGANDLMGYLGMRRDPQAYTVYDGPVGQTIFNIVNVFGGLGGFNITAPVFECYAPQFDDLLRKEVKRSIHYNLFGQTVIHPRHLRVIRDMYKVSVEDYQSAKQMLESQKAVVGLNGRMDELTTHRKWAENIMERKEIFGLNTFTPELAEVTNA